MVKSKKEQFKNLNPKNKPSTIKADSPSNVANSEGCTSTEVQPANLETLNSQPNENVKSNDNIIDPKKLLEFDQQSLLQGFIVSEVLGKPRSMRRGRW